MERSIPLWLLVICLFLSSFAAIGFGWAVKEALARPAEERTTLQRSALDLARYPDATLKAVKTLIAYGTGEYRDIDIRTEREADDDYSGFTPIEADPAIGLDGLLIRADGARMRPGWRLLAGAFTIDAGAVNTALLMSPDNRIVHRWTLDEDPEGPYRPQPPFRKFVHGIEILPDGSVIFAFDGGVSLQRFDKCSRRLWSKPGPYNHTVAFDNGRETVWTLDGMDSFVNVDVATGEVLRAIGTEDMIAANPEIDILELRRNHENELGTNLRNTRGEWLRGDNGFWQGIVLHYNDVEPLPAALADRFPMAQAGDLLVSARSLNLVFILDPDTLRIKWWRVGAGQRQHDPDWQPDGRITIFDNRMSRDYSQIVALDPVTFEREILFDGREADFYTRIRGKHQLLDDGTLVISSPQQGRAFEVDPHGRIALELVNTKPSSDAFNYTISELRWLPQDYFDVKEWTCPETD